MKNLAYSSKTTGGVIFHIDGPPSVNYDETLSVSEETQRKIFEVAECMKYTTVKRKNGGIGRHNGHMYPTKRFDQEERVMEYALRHTRVQNASYADEGMCKPGK